MKSNRDIRPALWNMTVDEVATLFSCTRQHVYNLKTEDSSFPEALKVCGRPFWREDQIRNWMKKRGTISLKAGRKSSEQKRAELARLKDISKGTPEIFIKSHVIFSQNCRLEKKDRMENVS